MIAGGAAGHCGEARGCVPCEEKEHHSSSNSWSVMLPGRHVIYSCAIQQGMSIRVQTKSPVGFVRPAGFALMISRWVLCGRKLKG